MTFESGVGESFDQVRSSTEKRVSHREIDRNLRRLANADRELAIEIGRWFLVARRTEAHREFGYASFFEYVQRLFGMGARAADPLCQGSCRLDPSDSCWGRERRADEVLTECSSKDGPSNDWSEFGRAG